MCCFLAIGTVNATKRGKYNISYIKSLIFMKESFEKLENNDYMIRSLKEEKEHTEKQMEDLFSYLAGEDQYSNQLKFFGDKYKQRIEEFQSLKIENQELKKQIADIRMSQNLKVLENQESNRVSMDRGRGQSWSKFGMTSETTSDPLRLKFQEIKKMKNEADMIANKENQQYDELIKQISKFFEKMLTVRRLENEMRPGKQRDGQEDTVTVPKNLYLKLVEVYSIKMADICAKEFEQSLKKKPEENKDKNLAQEQVIQDKFKVYYGDVIKEPQFEISYFFKKLAEKFGFANEWEMYHSKNINQSINFKGKIEKILNQSKSVDLSERTDANEESSLTNSLISQNFCSKISQLVHELDFSHKQKECWKKLNDKIKKEQLFDMKKLQDIITNVYKTTKKDLIDNISILLQSILRDFFSKMDNLLTLKLKNTNLIFNKLQKQLQTYSLKKKFQSQIGQLAANDIWRQAQSYTKQKLVSLFTKLQEYFIFASREEIYSSLSKSQ